MVDFLKKSRVITLLVCGAISALIAPILLTRQSFLAIFDFSQSGQIGDTIGGISGTILNFTGLLLVFFSFQEQFKANRNQLTMIEEERAKNIQEKNFYLIINLFNHFKEESSIIPISKIFHEYDDENAYEVYVDGKNYSTLQVKYLLELAEFIIDKSGGSNLKIQDREYINTIFVHYFFSNYEILLKGIEQAKEPCVNCGKIHYSPKVFEKNLCRIKDKIANLQSNEYLDLMFDRNTRCDNLG